LSLFWYWFFVLFFWVVGFVAAIILALLKLPILLAVGAVILFFGLGVLTLISGLWGFLSWRYELTTERVRVTHGLVSRTIHEADLEKVQDVLVQQHFWGRLLNYSNLSFNTAGSEGLEISFYNVGNPIALKEKFREIKKKRKDSAPL